MRRITGKFIFDLFASYVVKEICFPLLQIFFDEHTEQNYENESHSNETDSSSSSDEYDKGDSDYIDSEEEKEARKREVANKRMMKIAKRKEKADAKQRRLIEAADPNAPKKKRRYKKRAIKPKQTFECETCHYKTAHECKNPFLIISIDFN